MRMPGRFTAFMQKLRSDSVSWGSLLLFAVSLITLVLLMMLYIRTSLVQV